MTGKEPSQENGRLYRHMELKLESVVERLLSSKTDENDNVLSTVREILERIFVTSAMNLSGDNITRASRLLGISRNTLSRKLRELGKGA